MSVKINNSTINNNTTGSASIKSSQGSSSVSSSNGVSSFQAVFKGARLEDFNGNMQELIGIVRARGEEFFKSPEEGRLASYKESVKYFLNKVREEFLSLRDEFGADRGGEQKVYQLVDTAGGQADALTREAFTQDQALSLLTSLDDIRGLVLDAIA